MDFTFQRERFDYVFPEMIPLLKANYRETGYWPDIPLQINTVAYSNLSETNGFFLFTARDFEDRSLIGYAAFFVRYHLHTSSSLQAVQDVIYIDPKRRGFGMQFIKRCDQELKEMGVQVVYQHVNVKHDWGRILERIGYQEIERTFARRLDRE